MDIVVATPGRLVDHINKTPGFSLAELRFLVRTGHVKEGQERGGLQVPLKIDNILDIHGISSEEL